MLAGYNQVIKTLAIAVDYRKFWWYIVLL